MNKATRLMVATLCGICVLLIFVSVWAYFHLYQRPGPQAYIGSLLSGLISGATTVIGVLVGFDLNRRFEEAKRKLDEELRHKLHARQAESERLTQVGQARILLLELRSNRSVLRAVEVSGDQMAALHLRTSSWWALQTDLMSIEQKVFGQLYDLYSTWDLIKQRLNMGIQSTSLQETEVARQLDRIEQVKVTLYRMFPEITEHNLVDWS